MAEKDNRSSLSSWLAWVFALIFGGAFFVTSTPETSKTDPPKDAAKKDVVLEVAQIPDPLDVFKNVFRTPQEKGKEDWKNAKVQVLIATVPDPIDSRFAPEFDAAIDGIQKAFQTQGYLLSYSWFPWDRTIPKPTDPKRPNHHRSNPGSLLFIRNPPTTDTDKLPKKGLHNDRYFLVLLVGEHPISGIQKNALEKALDIVKDDLYKNPPHTIQIIAPFFSGSQGSFFQTLQEWMHKVEEKIPLPNVKVISGSGTAVRPQTWIEAAYKDRIQFSSTVIPNRLIERGVLDYLANRGATYSETISIRPGKESPCDECLSKKLGKVAFLRESNTVFGQSGNRTLKSSMNHSESKPELADWFIEIPFPLSISEMKPYFDKLRRKREEKIQLVPSRIGPESVLNRGSNPNFDGRMLMDPETAQAIGLRVLDDILATIRNEKIRYVGITATDSRDVLFLNMMLHDYCPDVLTFATLPDRIMTHPQESYHMRGLIIGSTYPLFTPIQQWEGSTKLRKLFTGHGEHGYYNAVLAHLHKEGQIPSEDSMIDFEMPFQIGSKRPPIWISQFAQNGSLIPLHCYPNYDDRLPLDEVKDDEECARYVHVKSRSSQIEAPTTAHLRVRAPFLFAFGLFILIGFAAMGTEYQAWRHHYQNAWGFFFAPWKTPLEIWEEVFLPIFWRLLWISGLAMFAIVGWGYWEWAEPGDYGTAILFCLLLSSGVIACFVIWSMVCLWSSCRSWRWVSALLILISIGWIVVGQYSVFDSAGAIFFVIRSTDFTSGLSPMLPAIFLMISLIWMSFFQLKLFALTELFTVPSPFSSDTFKRLQASHRDLSGKEPLRFGFSPSIQIDRLVGFLGMGLFLVFAFCFIFDKVLRTIEHRIWDYVFVLGFVIGTWMLCGMLIRFLNYWSTLRTLLGRISMLKVQRAFDNLPDRVVALFGGYLFAHRPRLSHLAIPIHQLKRISQLANSNANPNSDNPLILDREFKIETQGTFATDLEKQFEKDLNEGNKLESTDDRRQAYTKALMKPVTEYLDFLPEKEWGSCSIDQAFGVDKPDSSPARTANSCSTAWHCEAEMYIAMMLVLYISQFFVRLRTLATALVIGSLFLLFAGGAYPFYPSQFLPSLVLILIAVIAGSILYVLVAINRNELVSRITGTSPNSFTLDSGFLKSFGTFILPLIGLAIIHLSGIFPSLLEPILSLFR